MSDSSMAAIRGTFRDLHRDGLFVMPNPFDAGSARRLADAGFQALATTSSGHAATLGRLDQQVTREELIAHVGLLASSVDVPINVDAERCFPEYVGGVTRTVELLASAGAAGISIEDYDPVNKAVMSADEAVDSVAEAVASARPYGITITARAENFLYGGDLEDTLERLARFRDAGADVLYAPGVQAERDIAAIVSLGHPVNVLAVEGVPATSRLGELGVRRISTGGALTWSAYDAAVNSAMSLC